MNTKIATLNLCLSLKNKKEEIKRIIGENNIDILCLQETEIERDYETENLKINDYRLEMENNSLKSRTGVYVRDTIDYERRTDLEGQDKHLVILDLLGEKKMRIINLYRTFNPQNGATPRGYFLEQLALIRLAFTKDTIMYLTVK